MEENDNNAVLGTFVMDKLSGWTVKYQVSSNSVFSIDQTTGILQTIGSIDYEDLSDKTITLDVSGTAFEGSDARGAKSCRVTVKVLDVNEAPTLVCPGSLQVIEQSNVGTVLGSVSSTDPDGQQGVTYEITSYSTDGDSYLDVGSCNGDIILINSGLLFTEHPQ